MEAAIAIVEKELGMGAMPLQERRGGGDKGRGRGGMWRPCDAGAGEGRREKG
jgi:hypothetical protein